MHAQFQRQRTRRFETLAAMETGEREQSEARPIAVFRVVLLLQQPGDERAGCRADLLPPVDQSLRRPFEMGAVCHVLDDRGIAAHAVVTGVAGDAAATMQQFDHARRDARIELEADQRVRHAVAVLVDLDVIVDVNRVTVLNRASSYGCTGSGCKAGASSSSNALARHPGSFWNGRSFRFLNSGRIASSTD